MHTDRSKRTLLSRATDMNGIRVLITENDECKSVTESTVYRAVIKAALGDSACSEYDAPKTARKPKRARKAQPLDTTPIWTGISYDDMDMYVRQWDMETVDIPTNGYCGYIGISQQLQCSVPEAFAKLAAWASMGVQEGYDGTSDISTITGAAEQWDSDAAKPMNRKELGRSLWFEYGWMGMFFKIILAAPWPHTAPSIHTHVYTTRIPARRRSLARTRLSVR
jgi:hypothetical protein